MPVAAIRAHIMSALLFTAAPTPAQTWPAKPMRIVVGFVPGGGIGTEYVARVPADGYTLLQSAPVCALIWASKPTPPKSWHSNRTGSFSRRVQPWCLHAGYRVTHWR